MELFSESAQQAMKDKKFQRVSSNFVEPIWDPQIPYLQNVDWSDAYQREMCNEAIMYQRDFVKHLMVDWACLIHHRMLVKYLALDWHCTQ